MVLAGGAAVLEDHAKEHFTEEQPGHHLRPNRDGLAFKEDLVERRGGLLDAATFICFVLHKPSSDAAKPGVHILLGGNAGQQANSLVVAEHLNRLLGLFEDLLEFLHEILEAVDPRSSLVEVAQHLLGQTTELLAGGDARVGRLGDVVETAIITGQHLRNKGG